MNPLMTSIDGMLERSGPTQPTAGLDCNIRFPTMSKSSAVTASIFLHIIEGTSRLFIKSYVVTDEYFIQHFIPSISSELSSNIFAQYQP
mmetsp:Transcript_7304/g.10878  ORF Transcript_7304/g.10878 Transcript_7304/m.10878 type:complete len:89 (+) Transcript_7304:156-422(+)